MEQSRQSQDKAESRALLLEATELLETLKQSPTNRGKIQVLLGRLALQERRFSDAATHFEAGWNEGINNVSLAAELIYALQASGEKQRLKVYLDQMQSLVTTSPQLFDLFLAIQSDAGFAGPALTDQLARGWVQSIGDAGSYLRLARTLSFISEQTKPEEADTLELIETAYRRAIEMDPPNAEPWGDFLLFLRYRRNDFSKMQSELNTFTHDTRVSEFDRCFLVAQLFTQLNFPNQATRFWNSTINLAEAGENEATQSRVFAMAASFFASREEGKALELARKAVASDPGSPDNLRLLTAILSDANTQASLKEASSLLDKAKSLNRAETDVDKRIKASILTRRAALTPTEIDAATDRRKAAQILTSVEKPSEADFVQLARISGDLGDHQAALLALSDQARRIDASIPSIRAFVEYWQDHFADTTVLTDRLQQALLTLEGTKGAEIVALDLRLRPTKLTREEVYGVALKFVRKVVLSKRTAAEQETLLKNSFQMLGSKRMHDVSLRLLEEDLTPLNDAQKLTALLAVTTQLPGEAQFEVDLLKAVDSRRQTIDDAKFDKAAANYFFFRENWAEAEHFYRRCLQRDPRDAVAGNNLALVVAEHQKDFAEADRLIERGFAVLSETNNLAGKSVLLDTQSQLLLAAGKVDEAYAILEPLSQFATADVSVFLHLAECLRLQNRMVESRNAFAIAQQLGFAEGVMAPMEKRIYDRLTTVHITKANQD